MRPPATELAIGVPGVPGQPDVLGESGEPEQSDRSGRRPRGSRRTWVAAGVGVCLVLAVALWRSAASAPTPLTRADVNAAVQRGIAEAQRQQSTRPPAAATAYRTISRSLVTVTTERTGAGAGSTPSTTNLALGAGVLINARGAVLTALHVVEGGRQIRVQFADGTRGSARVVSRQAESDIAVLTVDRLPEVVVPAVMGGVPQVGEDVFAVGNPLGLQASLTAGVVSANGRSFRTEEGRTLARLIQFDAAVNPGNSGGPLLDRDGRVVGIVTGLANPSKQAYFVGIGFAVPIATAGGVAGGPQQ